MTECLARIKHNVERGELMMRSEHNHPVDENSYRNFLRSAVKVRKFTKKNPKAGSFSDANLTASSISSTESGLLTKLSKKKDKSSVVPIVNEIDIVPIEED